MIERIDPSEFPGNSHDRSRSAELTEFKKLGIGEALKCPCRWNHTSESKTCGGANLFRSAARRYGWRVRTSCQERVVYVMRTA